MKRLLTSLLILLTCQLTLTTFAQHRPKVAVVLSGGGAKGVAHVSALKVIEQAGIPIDMVVGTSMGSLVGGLYASGYTTEQLDSIVSNMEWMDILTDKVERNSKSLALKQKTEPYIISLQFEKSPFEVIEGGMLKGNSVSYLLSELTADHLQPMDYNDLPIPFACVATDLVTGKEIDMHRGILAESLRSSMAIPGVFPPVKLDSMVLVDGGLTNNFPVDVARRMGADYVIGVSVGSESLGYDKLNSTVDVLMQVLDMVCANKVEKNIQNCDIFMHVDVNGYSAASFTKAAIDTLIVRGDVAARDKWDELIALHDKLAAYGPLPLPNKVRKHINIDYATFTPPSTIYSEKNKASFIGIGARFDNEELASIKIGGEYEFNHNNHFRAGIAGRLGKRLDLEGYAGITPFEKWNIELHYRYSHYETRLYDEGKHISNLEYRKNRVLLDFSRSWRQVRVNFGGQFSYVHFSDFLAESSASEDLSNFGQNERTYQYYVSLQFDNQDSRLLPTKGMKWLVKYNYLTDNGYGFNGGGGVNVAEGYWRMAIPLARYSILTPSVEGRYIQDNNTYLSHCNYIGGVADTYGHYVTQQLSFAGINYYQIAPNAIIIGGLNYRQHLTTNNYLFTQFNYAFAADAMEYFCSRKHLFGAALGYGYKSPVGPIEFNLNWSNVTKKLGCFVNIGYMF